MQLSKTKDQLESFVIKSEVSSVYSAVVWGGVEGG